MYLYKCMYLKASGGSSTGHWKRPHKSDWLKRACHTILSPYCLGAMVAQAFLWINYCLRPWCSHCPLLAMVLSLFCHIVIIKYSRVACYCIVMNYTSRKQPLDYKRFCNVFSSLSRFDHLSMA